MGAPLKADWKLAQVLYCQGVKIKDIADKIGVKEMTLRRRIIRQEWRQTKEAAVQTVRQAQGSTGLVVPNSRTVTLPQPALPDSRNSRPTVRPALQSQFVQLAQALPAPPKGRRALREHADLVLAVTQGARLVEGWDQQAESTLICLQFLAQDPTLSAGPADQQASIPADQHDRVIDVIPEPTGPAEPAEPSSPADPTI